MNKCNLISLEEEQQIREQVRKELKECQARQQHQEQQRAAAAEEGKRQEAIERIRQDEEIRFYTEKGYVASGTTLDDNIVWQQLDQSTLVQKKRRKKHRRHRHHRWFSPKKYGKEILFITIFLSLLLLLYIYYKW